ncbi:unnamed protein product [Bursaphelenchus okinawaensis]|uniref:Uncharacterized protein n=1 Tax=Bursaphelenchus okinawaensis TaxID=465554 RepID=A0A811K1Z4_9BILA|nr:unnamed protein product [Bursaphelenchus okinawaensis]CAG9089309.1 unnamed protein product [Bursaphelenchus okinawaensis]
MVERQKSNGAPHQRLSDARNSEISGPDYGKCQTQGDGFYLNFEHPCTLAHPVQPIPAYSSSIQSIPVQSTLAYQIPAQPSSAQLSSVQLSSAQLSSAQLSSAQLSSVQLSSA